MYDVTMQKKILAKKADINQTNNLISMIRDLSSPSMKYFQRPMSNNILMTNPLHLPQAYGESLG